MKCTIPEISWHNRDPIFAVDIQLSSSDDFYRLASGGTDSHVVIWQLWILENGGISVEMLSDLTRHNRAVNAVRFSPDGNLLSSADDEAAIILWKRNEEASNDIFCDENEAENKEHWGVLKMLRGHIEDIYDLCWSSCSMYLLSGSVDNSAILWDVYKGKKACIFNDHNGFVQGVALDPQGQYASTLCTDRCLRIYNMNTKKLVHKVSKACFNLDETTSKSSNLFYDDTLKSFCRRLSFSPDGKLLVAPAGILEETNGSYNNVTHVFTRSSLSKPVACFSSGDKYATAVRFCPRLFQLRKLDQESNGDVDLNSGEMFNLPYRMVFAVATQNSVLIYDTQQTIPLAKISNIHYTRLTDLAWSRDGKILVISSSDGYCSLVSFSENELGTEYAPNLEDSSEPLEEKNLSFDHVNHAKNNKPEDQSKPEKIMQHIRLADKPSSQSDLDQPLKKENINLIQDCKPLEEIMSEEISLPKVPRRVSLITLSSPKSSKRDSLKKF